MQDNTTLKHDDELWILSTVSSPGPRATAWAYCGGGNGYGDEEVVILNRLITTGDSRFWLVQKKDSLQITTVEEKILLIPKYEKVWRHSWS